jgi:uncharacterized membrane protein YoaK (UPF0700 family)
MFNQRLPTWVLVGGGLLAAAAGMVNAVGALSVFHEALTHVTGTVTRGAIDLVDGEGTRVGHAAAAILAFIFGATIAGAVTGSTEASRHQRYAGALVVEATLLAVGALLMQRGFFVGELLCVVGAGLQNGLVTTWSGAIVRTTHATGLATDIGVALGHWLRGHPPTRLRLHLTLLVSFFVGGVAGAWLFTHVRIGALFAPSALCVLTAILYATTAGKRAQAE